MARRRMQARVWFSTAIHSPRRSPSTAVPRLSRYGIENFRRATPATHVIHSPRRFGDPFRTRPADAQADGSAIMKRLLLAVVGTGCWRRRRRSPPTCRLAPTAAAARAGLRAVLHLERLLRRHQRRLRLRPLGLDRHRHRVSTGNFNVNGALVGGTAGYNLQFGGCVLGLEGDIDWSNIKGSTTTNCAGTCETSNDWLGTARGRHRLRLRPLPALRHRRRRVRRRQGHARRASAASSETKVGWTAGGGLRIRLRSTTGRPRSNISMSISARRPATRPVPAAIRST